MDIPIIDDQEPERDETFFVKLFTADVEVMAIQDSVEVKIVDNDGKC